MSTTADAKAWEGRMYSGGWTKGSGPALEVLDKATDEVIDTVASATAEDVKRAAEVAAAAQPAWAEMPGQQRGRILRRAAALFEERTEAIVPQLVRETGSIPGKAFWELDYIAERLNACSALPLQPYGELVSSADPGVLSIAQRVPIGVVGVITPWNAPCALGIRAAAPALALGNAVLLKPDPQTPVIGGMLIAEILADAGLPEGLFHVLPGGADVGEAIVREPGVGMISFTGSSRVGVKIGEIAGAALKKVSLELGGNNAIIVLDDADVDAASSAGAWGSFFHQGQICMTAGRHLVHEAVVDSYKDALKERAERLVVGNPNTEEVALGPMINSRQLDRAAKIIDDSVSAGARVVTGGTNDGRYFQPTILDGVDPTMPAFTEEIFGPVAPITVFGSDDDAVALANNTSYGLVASILTSDVNRGLALARRLRCGMVHINDQTVNDEYNGPMGGMGISGNGGRFGAQAAWDEFTQWQWVTARDEIKRYPF